MRVPSREVRYGAFSVLSGVAAVAAGRCGGGSCFTCFACAVPGAAAVLLAAFGGQPAAAARAGPALREGQEPGAEPRSCATCRRRPTCEVARYTDGEVAICNLWERRTSTG